MRQIVFDASVPALGYQDHFLTSRFNGENLRFRFPPPFTGEVVRRSEAKPNRRGRTLRAPSASLSSFAQHLPRKRGRKEVVRNPTGWPAFAGHDNDRLYSWHVCVFPIWRGYDF